MKIALTYHHLTHHVVPGPQSFGYFVSLLLLPIALLIPRTVLSKWQNACIFLPTMTIFTLHAWYIMNGTDVISADVLFQALFFLVFQDPWTTYEYIAPRPEQREEDSKQDQAVAAPASQETVDSGERTPLKPTSTTSATQPSGPQLHPGQKYPSALRPRTAWVLTLLSSIRLNNWRIGHKSHDAAQPPPPAFRTRKSFLLQAIISFTRGYLILDLTRAYISYDAYFTSTTLPITSPLPFNTSNSSFASNPAMAQFLRSMIIALQAWSLISQIAYLAFLLPVTLNALALLPPTWSPHTWSPFFGSPTHIFSSGIRGFWGGYWHQTMRWMTSGPGYAVCDWLGLGRGSMARYAVISISAFGLSGVTHMGLVPPEPLRAGVSANAVRLYVAAFFWVQPVGMMVEVVAIKLARRMFSPGLLRSPQISSLRVVLNGLWVLAWFTLCLPLLGEAGRQLGYWRVWPVPVSVWKGLRGEGWVSWPFLVA